MFPVRHIAPSLLVAAGVAATAAGFLAGREVLATGTIVTIAGSIWLAAGIVLRRIDYAAEQARAEGYDDGYGDGFSQGVDHAQRHAQSRGRHRPTRSKAHLTLIQGGAAAAAVGWLWGRAREHAAATVSVAAMAGLMATGTTVVGNLEHPTTRVTEELPPAPSINTTPEPTIDDTRQIASDVDEPEPEPTSTMTATATPTPTRTPTPTPKPRTAPPTPRTEPTSDPTTAPTHTPGGGDKGRSDGPDKPRPCAAHDHAATLPPWKTSDGDDSDSSSPETESDSDTDHCQPSPEPQD